MKVTAGSVVGKFTYIINHLEETLGDDAEELTKESGCFSNMIPSDINGHVNRYDFGTFAGNYGRSI